MSKIASSYTTLSATFIIKQALGRRMDRKFLLDMFFLMHKSKSDLSGNRCNPFFDTEVAICLYSFFSCMGSASLQSFYYVGYLWMHLVDNVVGKAIFQRVPKHIGQCFFQRLFYPPSQSYRIPYDFLDVM